MSKGKGKEVAATKMPSALAPLQKPSTGSANPAASLSALWAYLVPALDHIVKSSTNNPAKAPSIDMEFYSGIHSACYNYITNSKGVNDGRNSTGTELYSQLDKYFAEAADEILLGAPDDSTLVYYLVPRFHRFSAGAQSINRLLAYLNRHYVKRAVDEDKGWFFLNDILEQIATTMTVGDARDKIAQRLQEKRNEELKKWGYEPGGSSEMLAKAEAAAEAASSLECIVPISSLAHRRFRTQVLEPLLAIPKHQGKKGKKKIPNFNSSSAPPGPKGRLARAVKDLLETKDDGVEERTRFAAELAQALGMCGIRVDHPLRKRLEKFTPPHS